MNFWIRSNLIENLGKYTNKIEGNHYVWKYVMDTESWDFFLPTSNIFGLEKPSKIKKMEIMQNLRQIKIELNKVITSQCGATK